VKNKILILISLVSFFSVTNPSFSKEVKHAPDRLGECRTVLVTETGEETKVFVGKITLKDCAAGVNYDSNINHGKLIKIEFKMDQN
jgi:hypothetical protein